jgi:hypothetical protein
VTNRSGNPNLPLLLFPMSEKAGTLICLGIVAVVLVAALWLDLSNQGLVWDLLWDLTGETEPSAQVLGFSQYVANYTRVAPRTASTADLQNIPENPFGVNTFLQLEALPENRERQVQMIADAGFGWIRQEFPWEDIEIHGRGDFEDRRNDHDGDGQVDEISAWDKYDNIVDLAEKYQIEMIVRLSTPPHWSQPPVTTPQGPPQDVQDFVNYAVAVARRYQGRVHYYQIWNEPNIYPEWGEQSINPQGYADMLCRTYQALKVVDPEIKVLTAAIGPTIDLSGRDAYDLLYLQRLYDFGISECYDILSAQAYGLFSGPTDRRMRTVLMNFARPAWLRDVMVANGDAEKPIWISEAGWNPVPTAAEAPDIAGRETYGTATMQQAADWIPLAYQRALSEWSWMGVMSYWYFKRPDDSEKNQSWYYFRLVEPDFTPTPLYESFQTMIQADDWHGWRDPSHSWERRARARVPQVLGIGAALAFIAYLLSRALLNRWMVSA